MACLNFFLGFLFFSIVRPTGNNGPMFVVTRVIKKNGIPALGSHSYHYGPNWTPRSPLTVIYLTHLSLVFLILSSVPVLFSSSARCRYLASLSISKSLSSSISSAVNLAEEKKKHPNYYVKTEYSITKGEGLKYNNSVKSSSYTK